MRPQTPKGDALRDQRARVGGRWTREMERVGPDAPQQHGRATTPVPRLYLPTASSLVNPYH